ncbi:MAG: nucleoside triphosphate hydrolase [Candidatus Scalindua sp.]|nr:AAA family ATPase [Planctomycetota bacterium]GJQ60848.1 MAG: nucleoside triphosphate hydrolase [Candidatus Scalindua sp.]
MAPHLEDLSRTILSKANGKRSPRFIVGITGGPGSGKSTLADQLREHINNTTKSDIVQILPMDGFHRRNSELKQLGLISLKGTPETFDGERYLSTLKRVTRGKIVKAPAYSRELHDVIDNALLIEPHHRIIITEGNYLLLDWGVWAELKDSIDFKIYREVKKSVCKRRLLERRIRGGEKRDLALEKIRKVDMQNFDLIAQTKKYADLVIS